MKSSFLFVSLFFIGWKAPVAKTKLFCLPGQSWIKYEGVHPLHQWQGATQDVNCVITYIQEKQQVAAIATSATLRNFDSRNVNRDSHALEVLDALIYPKVNFTSASIQETATGLRIHGKLNLHGVTKDIVFETHNTLDNSKLRVEGSFPVNLKDFEVAIPSLLGIKINPQIRVQFQFMFDINQ